MNALGDGDDEDTSFGGLPEELKDVGAVGRDVSGSVALQHHAFDRRAEEVRHGVAADGREQPEEGDVAVERRVDLELMEKERHWLKFNAQNGLVQVQSMSGIFAKTLFRTKKLRHEMTSTFRRNLVKGC